MKMAPGRKTISWWHWLLQRLKLRSMLLGDRGEIAAASFLRKKGMKIIARNRVHRKGEIDIIAIDKSHLVFVEVRTRSSDTFMTPESSIRHWKRKTLQATVRRLLRKHKNTGLTPRIDVVAVIWPREAKRPTDIRHHRGVIAVAGW